MDGWTERVMERARERKKMLGLDGLESHHSEPDLSEINPLPAKECVSETDITNMTAGGSPGQQTKTLNIQKDDFNMEIRVQSADNVRVEVEIQEKEMEPEEGPIRQETRSRLKKLAKLHEGGDDANISSPIMRTHESKFYEDMQNDQKENVGVIKAQKPGKGLSKLAALADRMNQWEDDLSHPSRATKKVEAPKKHWKQPAPQPPSSPVATPTKVKARAPAPPTHIDSPKKQLFRENTFTIDEETKKAECSKNEKTFTASQEGKKADVPKKAQCVGATPKQISWDKQVLDSLESQGYTRTQSSSRLVYAYNPQQPEPVPETQMKPNFKTGAVASKAAIFEQTPSSPVKPSKDPALLSLAERKALFEKNKGQALIPKSPFGLSAPVKVDTTTKACESKFIGLKHNQIQAHKTLFEETKPVKVQEDVRIGMKSGGIANKMAALLENKEKSTISEEQIVSRVREERQREMDMLLNRFNKNKHVTPKEDAIEEVHSEEESDEEVINEKTAMLKEKPAVIVQTRKSAEKRKSGSRLSTEADSPIVVSVLEDVKRIKVTQPKEGRLYPNLSDIEATTTDQETRTVTSNDENSDEEVSDSDDPNTSFGRDIMQAVCRDATPTKRVTYKDSSSSSDYSGVMDELDEILDEMDDSSNGPTPPKHSRHFPSPKQSKPKASKSFHYKSYSSSSSESPVYHQEKKFQSPNKGVITPRQSTELPLVVDGDNVMTLTHSVSVYRRQQNEVQTPVRQIIRQPNIEEESEFEPLQEEGVQEKIKLLHDEVNKQQNIISQTSQALNLCSSTPEFFGSTEQVEAERVLLVATHRRQTALHELQRLKVEGTIRPLNNTKNAALEKGTLTISDIVLPMKKKYVTALAAAGGKGHHVVCLIKCGEQVIPTKLVSTVASKSKNPDTDLYIPGSFSLNNVYSDFAVTFEVYCLQAQEECLPHEVKYHINKKPSKGLVTPKKNKQESRLVRPPKESPAGPQAVRTSSFALMGYVVFSVQAVNKRMWNLNNTPSMSPLEGSVEMKVSCELAVSIEHRGFLTMFEDVSGFGAWHRRWCRLKGPSLSYWKYPEDEKKSAPIDTIDLKSCITQEVGPVKRDICARMHTFLLERERPAYPQDKDTLVMVRKGDRTVIRHLLSADTKEERIEWCYKLNATLNALKWGRNKE